MRLCFERQFLLAGHGLALIGVAALATTHEVSPAFVALAGFGWAWSLWREWRGRGPRLSARTANLSMLVALALILAPVLRRGASPVRAIAEFLLVLAALKGVAPKENRDWLQIYVLSFFQLLAAAALTVEPVFALIFLAYLVLAPCVLVLFLLRREVGASGGGRRLAEEPFVEPSLFRSIAATTSVLFVSTLLIFIVFPRMGAGYFSAPFSGGTVLAGFSEEVGAGAVAALKQDDAVALRVTVDRPDLVAQTRYWRGAALDHFDGRSWRRRPQELRPLLRPEPGTFTLSEPAPHASVIREEIILEPQDSAVLFFAGRPLEIRGRFLEVSSDPLGNLRVLRPTGVRIRYELLASLAPRRAAPSAAAVALPSSVDSRIVELARREVEGTRGDPARAAALLRHFRRGFRYTLAPGDPRGEDPLVRFLFETRSGHCEYFASAYAVMLRAVGIPSLVVNGYAGGEWNPYGGYFLIRQRDAHSWVEAYVDGEWRTFDPTPPGAPIERTLRARVADLVDALQMRWHRYVINYTLEDQADAALSLRNAGRRFWERLSADWRRARREENGTPREERWPAGRSRAALGAVVLVGFTLWAWRRRRRAGAAAGAVLSAATRDYLRMLRALEGRGLHKRPGETPEEFSRRASGRLERESERVAQITALYEEARFSGRDVAPASIEREVDSLVAALGAARDRAGATSGGA
ncbi:MAG: DUF3488 domain-containing protein [Deltaproteobacteria bacterium]|nr:DUF3488 domain-containing protein [Deltaproteobacteria bacterium]